MEVKRPSERGEDILSNPIKRQKLAELVTLATGKAPPLLPPSNGYRDTRFDHPQLHNVPANIVPVLQNPYQASDFFSDYSPIFHNDEIRRITKIFPPPFPPPIQNSKGGWDPSTRSDMMIPFIYPAPPVIMDDPYVDDMDFLSEGSDTARYSNNRRKQKTTGEMVELAPLPFPPPNYMPYPLRADKSSVIPSELFTDLLDASMLLPRIDMVLASAAGSLYDLKLQAIEEGFSVQQFNQLRLQVERDQERRNEMKDNEQEEQYEYDGRAYYDNININNEYDSHQKIFPTSNEVRIDNYPGMKITPQLSNVKHALVSDEMINDNYNNDSFEKFDEYASDVNYEMEISKKLPIIQEILKKSNRIGTKESSNKKAEVISDTVQQLDGIYHDLYPDNYKIKKNQLIKKVQDLTQSKILLIDEDNLLLKDEELIGMKQKLGQERDIELMRLKFQQDYEILRSLLTFYQDSNKVYKKFNSNFVSKLLKLKNFFEYQKKVFENLINNEKNLNELVDLNTRESTKIFNDISHRNYHTELKDIMKMKVQGKEEDQIKDLVDALKTNDLGVPLDSKDDVTDFMPVATTSEFEILTTNITKKEQKISMSSKHEIFRSHLYETSGSESTSGPSAPELPKRRGRRAANISELDDDNQYSETFLLARILKHFVGPQPVNSEQMTEDFGSMGIISKWA